MYHVLLIFGKCQSSFFRHTEDVALSPAVDPSSVDACMVCSIFQFLIAVLYVFSAILYVFVVLFQNSSNVTKDNSWGEIILFVTSGNLTCHY